MINPTETTGVIIARLEKENAALLTRCKKAEQEHQYALTEIDRQSFMVQSLQAENAALRAENDELRQRGDAEWQFGYEDGIAGVCKDGTTVESEDYKCGNNTGFHDRIRLINFHNRPLREMLKRLEWSGRDIYGMQPSCPICEMPKASKHWSTCALAALLKGENNDAL